MSKPWKRMLWFQADNYVCGELCLRMAFVLYQKNVMLDVEYWILELKISVGHFIILKVIDAY